MRNRIKAAVKSYHSHLTQEWLENQSSERLLAWCHPLDRKDFRNEMENN